jgi:hypothetical protein
VSKDRALRRAAREAEVARLRARRERAQARKARRRALIRRLRPPRRGRTGHLYPRRALGQRIGIALVALLAIGFVWWRFDDLTTRLALTIVITVAAPAVVVLTLGRRT